MEITYKQRLIKHIEALEKSYDNIILILMEDLEFDEDTGKLELKDFQKKIYAEGLDKSSATADALLERIKVKQTELEELDNPNLHKEVKEDKGNLLSNRLK